MPSTAVLRIGTRGSPLALVQADEVRRHLAGAHVALAGAGAVQIATIRTSGDAAQDRLLADIGGKGLFTKEIDQALLEGRVDLAVHSMKDVPTWLPDGLAFGCVLAREDPRDAFVSRCAGTLAELPAGATIGTASLRRQAQILHRRPDLKAAVLRGNVETRIRKIAEGAVDATLLALAGLKRLGRAYAANAILPVDEILPAVGQGAVAVVIRASDARVRDFLAPLDDAATHACVRAERAMLAVLDGSCRTPIAGYAEIADGRLRLRGLVATPDGARLIADERSGAITEADAIGRDLGEALRRAAGPDFFAQA